MSLSTSNQVPDSTSHSSTTPAPTSIKASTATDKNDPAEPVSTKESKPATAPDSGNVRLQEILDYLKEDTHYLGLQSIRQQVCWHPENRGHRLVVEGSDDPSPVILTVIGTIGVDDFFLSPDGAYKGKSDFTSSLADVKLSCICRRPAEPGLAAEFGSALLNLTWLMDKVWTPGHGRVGVTLPSGSTTATQFKVRHILFKVGACFCQSVVC